MRFVSFHLDWECLQSTEGFLFKHDLRHFLDIFIVKKNLLERHFMLHFPYTFPHGTKVEEIYITLQAIQFQKNSNLRVFGYKNVKEAGI